MDFDADVPVEGSNDVTTTPEGGAPATPNPLEPGGVRFEQVYGKFKDYENKYNQYKEFGDPVSVRDRLKKLEQWEKTVEDYKKQEAQTPDEKAEAQRAAQIRKELLKVYPELAEVQSLKELKAAIDELKHSAAESRTEAVLRGMSEKFTDVLKTAKISPKYQAKIEEYVVSQMSQEERENFVKGDFEVAKRIFDTELKDGLFASMGARTPLPSPAVRNTPGGTPPQGQVAKAKTLSEAADEGWSRYTNRA